MPVSDQFWGDRYGKLKDPFGHKWSIATHTKDMSQDEMKHAMDDAMQRWARCRRPHSIYLSFALVILSEAKDLCISAAIGPPFARKTDFQ